MTSGSSPSRPSRAAPVIALGRGGVSETIDARVGRTYSEPTPEGLVDAIESWESDGSPHDPVIGRRRAESYALPLFRERLLGYIASVAAGRRDEGESVRRPRTCRGEPFTSRRTNRAKTSEQG